MSHHATSLLTALGIAAALSISGCSERPREHTILPAGAELREGDVVTRRGAGVESRLVCAADSTGLYSHIGIVARHPGSGELVVVHAVPGEAPRGEPEVVKADTPQAFFSSQRALTGAIWRPADPELGRRAALHALTSLRRRALFDDAYDFADTTRLYCCELVELAYRNAGASLASGRHSQVWLPPAGHIDCWLPSDLYTSPLLRHITTF